VGNADFSLGAASGMLLLPVGLHRCKLAYHSSEEALFFYYKKSTCFERN
jgi:hypothetical protein